jgi:hypothetical protein
MEQSPYTDPAALAASVREIALRARRVLRDPCQTDLELRDLSRRIDQIRHSVPRSPANPLALWLENLSREVDAEKARERRRARSAAGAWVS